MGAGPISICLDRAPVHTAGVSRKKLEELFDNVYFQTPKSPDLSMCDAGVFPWMEREQQRRGARSKREIRATVADVWKALKPAMLKKVAGRVRQSTNFQNLLLTLTMSPTHNVSFHRHTCNTQ